MRAETEGPELSKTARALLVLAFFLSGAAALAYEVAWSRALLLLLGSTAAASAVVLGVFVGALGLGARWGGRLADRSTRPLLLYGVFEIGAAAWALLAAPLVGLLHAPYLAVAPGMPGWLQMVLRVFVAVLVVAPPAFLLGATLPAMVRQWVRRTGETGRQTAWLYGVNTVGAVVGCLGAGFYGVAALGVNGMVLVAAAVGAAVGLVAILAAWRGNPVTADEAPAKSQLGGWAPEALTLAARTALLCGFIGLATEVLGFRILVFFLEGFTVTFAAMLGVFIAGLGLGSLLLGPALARTKKPARTLSALLLLQAATLLFGLYVVMPSLETWMHAIRDAAYEGARSSTDIAAGLRTSSLIGAGLLLIVPALLMGPTFALCVRWAELGGDTPGRAVGRIYLWNSLGSLLAPFLITFLFVPLFHVPGAWVAVTLLTVASGINLWLLPRWRTARVASLHLAASIGLILAVGVLWLDLPGTRPADLVESSVVLRGQKGRRLLRVSSDAVTTASVVETVEGERYLYTDDFAAAATGRHYRYMRMLGHLPCLLADKPRKAMVIAFGTGTTAGAVARHDEVEQIEVVEVSGAVLDLASYFIEANRNVLEDPRVVQVRDDGRNALLLHEPNLDVITLEPLMPYSPQGYPFYTREFYELARDRLTDGGVLCQWVPVHAMPVGLYTAFIHAFFEVFPDGSLWFFEQSTALIGRKGDRAPNLETVMRRMEAVADDLDDAGFETPALLHSGYVASGREVLDGKKPADFKRFIDRPMVDMDPFPEFEPTPRAPLNTPYLHQTVEYLGRLVEPETVPDAPWWFGGTDRTATRFALAGRAREAQADFLAVSLSGMKPSGETFTQMSEERLRALEDAVLAYQRALRDLPGERVLQWRRVRALRKIATTRAREMLAQAKAAGEAGKTSERIEFLQLAEQITRATMPPALFDPDPVTTRRTDMAALRAAILLRLGRCNSALKVLETSRVDLQDIRREGRLNALIDDVKAHIDGTPVEPREDDAWVFDDRAPCRAEGTAPVADELKAFLEALGVKAHRIERMTGKRLVDASQREDVADAVVAELPKTSAQDLHDVKALLACVRFALDESDGELRALFGSDDPAVFAAALIEVGWWGLLERHFPDVVKTAHGHKLARVRAALATAASKYGAPGVLRYVVDLLMDVDEDVRSEAWSVFLTHRPDAIQGYDPKASADQRKPVYEALKKALP